MKTVYVQGNKFLSQATPTTQEDNHFGIYMRWDLFSDTEGKNKVGSLICYNDGNYAVLHPNAIRYTFAKNEVGFC